MKKLLTILASVLVGLASFFPEASMAQTPPQPALTNIQEVAPQLAVGCQGDLCWQTVVTLINRTDGRQGIDYFFLDNASNALYLTQTWSDGEQSLSGGGGISMAPKKNATFTLSANGGAVRTGVIKFFNLGAQWSTKQNRYLPNMEVQVVFQLVNRLTGKVLSSVGVSVSEPDSAFMGQAMVTEKVDIGVAMYNDNAFPIKVRFTVYNPFLLNSPNPYAVTEIVLQSKQQLPKFLSELFPNLGNDSGGNKITDGNMSLVATTMDGTTPAAFYVTFVRSDNSARDQYSSVPVFAGREN